MEIIFISAIISIVVTFLVFPLLIVAKEADKQIEKIKPNKENDSNS